MLEHRVAGDLHVPNMTNRQRGRLAGPGGGVGGAGSPTKDLRRRPMLRPSQQSGGPPSPSPKGAAAQGGQKRGGGGTATSPSKKAGSDGGQVRCWSGMLHCSGRSACCSCMAGAASRVLHSMLCSAQLAHRFHTHHLCA